MTKFYETPFFIIPFDEPENRLFPKKPLVWDVFDMLLDSCDPEERYWYFLIIKKNDESGALCISRTDREGNIWTFGIIHIDDMFLGLFHEPHYVDDVSQLPNPSFRCGF